MNPLPAFKQALARTLYRPTINQSSCPASIAAPYRFLPRYASSGPSEISSSTPSDQAASSASSPPTPVDANLASPSSSDLAEDIATTSPSSAAEGAAASLPVRSTSSNLDKVMKQMEASTKRQKGGKGPRGGPARVDEFTWMDKFGTDKNLNSNRSHTPTVISPDDRWKQLAPVTFSEPLTTTTSRSFPVQNFNLGLAYRKLNKTLMENNIRRELKRQERFESGSDKRVRLDSERHRRRFKVAVGKSVSLSMRMKSL